MYIKHLNSHSHTMRSAFGTTHRTNRESERDAHRVRNTDLEETYGAPNTLAQKIASQASQGRNTHCQDRKSSGCCRARRPPSHPCPRKCRGKCPSARRECNKRSAIQCSSKPIQKNTRTASAMHSINHPNLRFLNSSHRMITAGLGMMSATGVVG